jgi:hypothetical protein
LNEVAQRCSGEIADCGDEAGGTDVGGKYCIHPHNECIGAQGKADTGGTELVGLVTGAESA